MTTIEITLPDALAQEAEQADLLTPEAMESLLRGKLQAHRLTRLQQARSTLLDAPVDAMTPAELNAEIGAYRQAQRVATGS